MHITIIGLKEILPLSEYAPQKAHPNCLICFLTSCGANCVPVIGQIQPVILLTPGIFLINFGYYSTIFDCFFFFFFFFFFLLICNIFDVACYALVCCPLEPERGNSAFT